MKRIGRVVLIVAIGVVLYFVGRFGYLTWIIAHPEQETLPLSDDLVSDASEQGEALRARAEARADLDALRTAFEPQQYRSYCGVASGVIALAALGYETTQDDFFDPEAADAVRSARQTFYGGMSLHELDGLLEAHGVRAEVRHASDGDLETFRREARENLERDGDVVLVNYARRGLEQRGGGHISPLGAYDTESDRFLVLDVASYRYPAVWVRAEQLFAAMNTPDSSSGRSRGYVLVAR